MKLAIVGTRSPEISYELFSEIVAMFVHADIDTIVSGGAKGIDSFAARYAKEHNLNLIEFLPDYKRYGKPATMIRNSQIVEAADIMLAFPSVDSKGTKDSIRKMEKAGKKTIIHPI